MNRNSLPRHLLPSQAIAAAAVAVHASLRTDYVCAVRGLRARVY